MSNTDVDWTAVLRLEGERIRAVAAEADLQARVPTCPEWDLAALLDHLGRIYAWVDELVQLRARERRDKPPRDDTMPVVDWFASGTTALAQRLDAAEPDPELWTWATETGKVADGLAFWRRRMAHETLVHRYDAELAAEVPVGPVGGDLARDGIDELWEWFAEGVPDWMTFAAGAGVIRVEATDAEAAWTLSLGRATGTTGSGRELDLPAAVFTDEDPDTTVRAPIGQLHRWLWGRGEVPPSAVDGTVAHVVLLRATIADAS